MQYGQMLDAIDCVCKYIMICCFECNANPVISWGGWGERARTSVNFHGTHFFLFNADSLLTLGQLISP